MGEFINDATFAYYQRDITGKGQLRLSIGLWSTFQ